MDSSSFADAFLELNQRFVRLVDELSALRVLSNIDLETCREEEILETALEALLALGEFEHCTIYLHEGGRLVRQAAAGWQALAGDTSAPALEKAGQSLGQGPVGYAASSGRLQHVPELSEGGSCICAPVRRGGQLLGVIEVRHTLPRSFQTRHEQLLEIFAGFLAQTLIGWRYFHRLDRETEAQRESLNRALRQAEDLERRYRALSVVDELTGIHNRRFFFPEAGAALAGALRYRQEFSILLLDLDRLRDVNETLGRPMGDEILRMTAALLEGQKRESDILARFGGDEFVFALPNTDAEGAGQLAARILDSLRALSFEQAGQRREIRASIGIASVTTGGTTRTGSSDLLETLLQRADQALHLGKVEGRDRFRVFGMVNGAGERN